MYKIKKIIQYLLGLYAGLVFSYLRVSVQAQNYYAETAYGISPNYIVSMSGATWWERIISFILSPIVITFTIILAFVIGIIYFMKKRVNNKAKGTTKASK